MLPQAPPALNWILGYTDRVHWESEDWLVSGYKAYHTFGVKSVTWVVGNEHVLCV